MRKVSDSADIFESTYLTTSSYFILKDFKKMNMIVSYLSAWGTDYIINGDPWNACSFAVFSNVFKQYAAILLKTQSAMDWNAVKELNEADEDTLINFFREHIPCSCLDDADEKGRYYDEFTVKPANEKLCAQLEAEEEKICALLEAEEEECRAELSSLSADEEDQLEAEEEKICALLEAEEAKCRAELLALIRADEKQLSVCDVLQLVTTFSANHQRRIKKYEDALADVCRVLVKDVGKK